MKINYKKMKLSTPNNTTKEMLAVSVQGFILK